MNIFKRPRLWTSLAVISTLLSGCSAGQKGPEVPEPITESLDAKGEDIPTNENALPLAFQQSIAACEGERRYFDISTGTCTSTQLATFPCELDKLLDPSSFLNEVLRDKLKKYMTENLVGYTLLSCTETVETYELHFYQVNAGKVRTYNVKLLKPG